MRLVWSVVLIVAGCVSADDAVHVSRETELRCVMRDTVFVDTALGDVQPFQGGWRYSVRDTQRIITNTPCRLRVIR